MNAGLITLALLLDFLSPTTASCAHGTSLLKRQILERASSDGTVKTVAVGTFGYTGATGPANWASLATENMACATSKVQSPIDVTNTSTSLTEPGTLAINFPKCRICRVGEPRDND